MRNRNLIAPAVLIAVGVLALLVNLGAIPTDRLYRLADLWPLLLVVLGLVLLINRARFPPNVEMTAAAVVVLLAVVGAAAYVAVGPAIPTSTQHMTASAPVESLKEATLEFDVGATTLHVQGSTSMVQDLFQAQITYSGPQPSVDLDRSTGRVVVRQNSQFGYFGRQSLQIDMQINVAVRWAFVVNSGASMGTYDVPNVDLASIVINTGASTENITLPNPSGTVPVRINGGALTVHLHRPGGSAASVRVSGGAVSLTFDGSTARAVGSVSAGTASAPDRFDVSVNGGACTVTMDASGPA